MKKYCNLIIVSLLLSSLSYAQVGVGTEMPSAGLDVVSKGNTNATKALEINNSANTEMVTVLDNGNMGIGNVAPTRKLDINNGTTAGAIKIVDGTQGAGRVLTSDANGVGTWSPTPATSLYFLSSNIYAGTTEPSDFTGTVNPVAGASVPNTTAARFLVNPSSAVLNLGPSTTYTTGSTGLSYRIPVSGMYRITLYVDSGYPATGTPGSNGGRIDVTAYRGTVIYKYNRDFVTSNNAGTMINIWQLEAGDVVVPISVGIPAPGTSQFVETTFTVERVN